jgi:hypothetical protein
MIQKLLFLLMLIVIFVISVKAQDSLRIATKEDVEEVKGAFDGINETLQSIIPTLDALKKIKISGYIQTQFQVADSAGVPSVAGGDFSQNVKSRFQVRRGRFKINYDNDLTQYVLQLDVTQNGVGIKEAYTSIKEPWLRMASLAAGVFDRPFGFELSYSSGKRESPERSRIYQTLFPGDRELGAKIELAPETGPLSYFNLKAGLFNGVLNTANENDRNKDFIGRLGFQLPFQEQSLEVDGGFSIYSGNVTSNSPKVYELDKLTKKFVRDSTLANLGNSFNRSYNGFDVQLYYDVPVIGGASMRFEYIWGKQPATDKKTSFYNPDAASTGDTKSAIDGKKVAGISIIFRILVCKTSLSQSMMFMYQTTI